MDTRTEQVLTAFDMLKDRIDDIDCTQNRGITLLTLAITLAALVIGAIQVWLATRGEAMNIRERLSGGGAQYIPLSSEQRLMKHEEEDRRMIRRAILAILPGLLLSVTALIITLMK